ncbi:MAG: hypothetical protein GY853_10860 [PVC group bacterium]|nr:hypothetical protein [PVC group bacterium]
MIKQEMKNIKSTKKELREFALTIGNILAVISCILLFKEKSSANYFLLCGAILIGLGVTCPLLLKPIQKIWMGLAVIIGWLMSRIILTVFFYSILTPLSLCARLFNKKFLDLKIDETANSYWIKRKELNNYEKQF